MVNAKQEFIDHINERFVGGRTVKCAEIKFEDDYSFTAILPVNYTPVQYEKFLNSIDRDYDEGYGGQNLFGTVWYMEDSTWSSRGEYDGLEWYEFMEIPEIPNELLNTK